VRNAHHRLRDDEDLDLIFTLRGPRKASPSLTLQCDASAAFYFDGRNVISVMCRLPLLYATWGFARLENMCANTSQAK
jgi:hypothetical protein